MATPAEVAARYRIDRRLGAGGMSTVFLATDTVLERPVAIKLLAEHLAEDEAFVARFRREALAAARLQHPNVVQVFDSGRDESSDRHYIVMEYVEGWSCADLLREHKQLEVAQAVRIARDACHGLDYAHRAGVVHRDVKPGNLLVSNDTGGTKLADFGIAKAAEQTRITQVGSVLGTAAYLSPEQARGEEAGPPSDIYSLGVCAYQFLAGRLPHEYSSLTELALKQQESPVEPIASFRPEVPAELDSAIRLCLERDPNARYPSALELAQAVEAGFYGQATDVTQRLEQTAALGAATDATRRIPEQTAATRALGTRTAPPPARRPPPRRREPDRRQRRRRRGLGGLLAALLVVLAGAAVIVAILSSGSGGGVDPVVEQEVQEQIDGIRQFLEENSR
jgi:serine/threonine protein kinase